jgi:hypothetical protein
MRRILAVVGLLGALAACGRFDASSSSSSSNSEPAENRQGPVLMYGDSLLEEASPYVRTTDQVRAFGGTALCDWVDNIARASVLEQPSVMVVEFVGNNLTPCMEGYRTPEQVRAKYEADAARLKQRVDAPILWVGPPEFRHGPPATKGLFETEPLFVDAGAAVLSSGGYANTLPCLADEGRGRGCDDTGRIRVRSPDGTHFCPNGKGPCDVYSSGGRRFANAIDEAVRDQR